jgi:hypothetical protein
VTLELISNAPMFSLQFNVTVVNTNPLGPSIPVGNFSFASGLRKPIPGTTPVIYEPIPPYMFIGDASDPPPPGQIVSYNGTNFVDLEVASETNGIGLLAVGWLERSGIGATNLFDTKSQDLIQFSQAHDTFFLQANGRILLGSYGFVVPTNSGQTYQIQIGRPSATTDGVGDPGSSIYIATPTNGSLAGGTVNSIKDVTLGQLKYIAGDSAPFHWFNAGDFGNTNLDASDVAQVFQTAVYSYNAPLAGSDFEDSMNSSGALGVMDSDPDSPYDGYYTNAGPLTVLQLNDLFNGDYTTMDQMAFGDTNSDGTANLDVSDVYVTFIRSEDPNRTWYRRFWLDGVRVAETVPNVFNPETLKQSPGGKSPLADPSNPTPLSITNTPLVNFTAGDFQATPGEQISIPVTASIFGSYPLRVLMLNISVVPLDGSPALTTPISFTLNPPFNNTSDYNPDASGLKASSGNGNYAIALLPVQFPIPQTLGVSNNAVIGTLTITIPANATSSSAYAVHFDHASGSPNGVVSFPKTTLTGLITLSDRSSSYYNDGIPDSWRLRYFGTIYNELSVSNADADGTGMNNWQKYLAGLDPTDPNSKFVVGTDQSVAQGPQDKVIYWPSVSGKTYVIERSTTLFPSDWIPVSTNNGTGGYMEIHDTSGGKNDFYRVSTQ